ncbi:hypothetical protein AVEN_237906-1 [Araneus ventricosus]|uniref:Uncharacterized protein n=1 Tax=Araneus ventricosus TaxID=182803 RepID=A0A4Y2G189_ARAVE|nr:hypothetical protein AVEN_237906-1 [Araneus ventricosus]
MATTSETLDMATTVISTASLQVVDEISSKPDRSGPGKGAISKKLSRKSNLKVPLDVAGQPRPFGTNIEPPLERSPQDSTTRVDPPARINPNMIAPGDDGYMELNSTNPMEGTSTGFSVTTEKAGTGLGFFQTVEEINSIETMSDDTLDSESFQEAFSTPQGMHTSLPSAPFLKDPPASPAHFVVGTPPAPLAEKSVSRRKRRSVARNPDSGSKQKKGSSGDGSGTASTPRAVQRKGDHKLFANFYRSRPGLLVPDSPHTPSVGKARLQGEVPPTPSRLLPQTDIINVQQHMQYILSTRAVDAGTAECLMDFAGLLDQLLINLRQELAAGLPARVPLSESSGTSDAPARHPVQPPLQSLATMSSAADTQTGLGIVNPPPPTWAQVTSKKKVSTAKPPVPIAPSSAQRPIARPSPVLSLPPRPSFPVVLVHPSGEPPVAAQAFKSFDSNRDGRYGENNCFSHQFSCGIKWGMYCQGASQASPPNPCV